MPSAFPGMDPYLEQDDAWHDFHEQFCLSCRQLLVPHLEPNYIAKVDEHLYIHELDTSERRFLGRGDLTFANTGREGVLSAESAALLAPVAASIPLDVDVWREARIEIRDRRSRELITVLELLSPANKQSGGDRQQYLAKRTELLMSKAHLVELDLLRGGRRLPLEQIPACDYYALVSRAEQRPSVELWPIQLRDSLPTIPIPLRAPDADIPLDLRQAFDLAFAAGGYQNYIYTGSPVPELTAADAAWANALLARASR